MGWFSQLFARDEGQRKKRSKNAGPASIEEVQAHALVSLLTPQLQLLGLDLYAVPVRGIYVSKRSRGYIYGMAAGILGETSANPTADMAEDIMQAAFTLVWGRASAQPIFEMTLSECAARDGQTLAGSYAAERDVSDFYADKPFATVMGFWALNNGLNDPAEIMPAIENGQHISPEC